MQKGGREGGKKGVPFDFEYKKLLNINMCSSHKILKSFIALYGVTFFILPQNFRYGKSQ